MNRLRRPLGSFPLKLTAALAMTLLPLLALMASGYASVRTLLSAVDETVTEVLAEIHPVYNLQTLLPGPEKALRAHLLGNPSAASAPYHELRSRLDWAFEYVRQTTPFSRQEEHDLMEAAQREWRLAREVAEQIRRQAPPAVPAAMAGEMARFDGHIERIESLFEMVIRLAGEEIKAEHQRVRDATRRMLVHVGGVLVFGILSALVAGWAIRRSVRSPLQQLNDGVERIGRGELSHRAPVPGGDEFGQLATALNRMAHNLQRSYAELEELSLRDALTQLYNRRELQLRLSTELDRASRHDEPLSLLMIDIDHFKAVNDRHGHLVGDATLRSVARVLLADVRPSDLVARYGGEEFVVLLPETTAAGAGLIAERIRRRIAQTPLHEGDDAPLAVTVSIGVAAHPEHGGGDGLALLRAADRALYAAKSGGRNRVEMSAPAAPQADPEPPDDNRTGSGVQGNQPTQSGVS